MNHCFEAIFDLIFVVSHRDTCNAGWSSLVARQAHNLKVAGSNPAPATNFSAPVAVYSRMAFAFAESRDFVE